MENTRKNLEMLKPYKNVWDMWQIKDRHRHTHRLPILLCLLWSLLALDNFSLLFRQLQHLLIKFLNIKNYNSIPHVLCKKVLHYQLEAPLKVEGGWTPIRTSNEAHPINILLYPQYPLRCSQLRLMEKTTHYLTL